jgi:hypothetical protein
MRAILSILLFLFVVSAGYAQQRVLVSNDTRSIAFSENEVILTKITGEEMAFSLAELRVLVFDDGTLTEIDELIVGSGLYVYATATEFVVKTDEEVKSLTLFDLSGKVLRKVSESIIGAADIQKGIYILRIETENGVETKKVIKQ